MSAWCPSSFAFRVVLGPARTSSICLLFLHPRLAPVFSTAYIIADPSPVLVTVEVASAWQTSKMTLFLGNGTVVIKTEMLRIADCTKLHHPIGSQMCTPRSKGRL